MSLFVQRALTFLLVMLGWVFFRSESMYEMIGWFESLVGIQGMGHFVVDANIVILGALVLYGLLIVQFLPNAASHKNFVGLTRGNQVALGILTSLAFLFVNYSSKFLYFQF